MSVDCTYYIFENNFGIIHKFTKYLNERYDLGFDTLFLPQVNALSKPSHLDFSKIVRAFLATTGMNE